MTRKEKPSSPPGLKSLNKIRRRDSGQTLRRVSRYACPSSSRSLVVFVASLLGWIFFVLCIDLALATLVENRDDYEIFKKHWSPPFPDVKKTYLAESEDMAIWGKHVQRLKPGEKFLVLIADIAATTIMPRYYMQEAFDVDDLVCDTISLRAYTSLFPDASPDHEFWRVQYHRTPLSRASSPPSSSSSPSSSSASSTLSRSSIEEKHAVTEVREDVERKELEPRLPSFSSSPPATTPEPGAGLSMSGRSPRESYESEGEDKRPERTEGEPPGTLLVDPANHSAAGDDGDDYGLDAANVPNTFKVKSLLFMAPSQVSSIFGASPEFCIIVRERKSRRSISIILQVDENGDKNSAAGSRRGGIPPVVGLFRVVGFGTVSVGPAVLATLLSLV